MPSSANASSAASPPATAVTLRPSKLLTGYTAPLLASPDQNTIELRFIAFFSLRCSILVEELCSQLIRGVNTLLTAPQLLSLPAPRAIAAC